MKRKLSPSLSPEGFRSKRRPSFSNTSYADVREGLSTLPEVPASIETVEGPTYRLPAALQTDMYKRAWESVNVYGDREVCNDNEARRVRIFEPYIVPIVNLFEGRLIDKPEATLGKTNISSGGRVEHEIYIIGGVLLVVVEIKKDTLDSQYVTQLIAELVAAASKNKMIPGFEALRVRGILTNLNDFYFYTFDPTNDRTFAEPTMQSGLERRDLLRRMISVANKIFSFIFTSYMEAISCSLSLSIRRGEDGDSEETSSAMLSQLNRAAHSSRLRKIEVASTSSLMRVSRPSTSHWEQAYQLAEEAITWFEKPGDTFEARDDNYTKAIECLRQSALAIPAYSPKYDLDKETLDKEALDVVKSVYEE